MNKKQACEAFAENKEVVTTREGLLIGHIVAIYIAALDTTKPDRVRADIRCSTPPGKTITRDVADLELLSDREARIEAARVERARAVFANVADSLKPRGLRVLVHKYPGGSTANPSFRGSIEAVSHSGYAVVVMEHARTLGDGLLIFPAGHLHEYMDLDTSDED